MPKCPDCERECACPKCNCHSGLVHVPIEGNYLVVDGKVSPAVEVKDDENE